ncbi:MAG: GFA family protein [Hyphomicrobiaceae bacterium]
MSGLSIRRIHGSCHCGNIRYALDWPDPGATIPARACGCGHCTKHRAAWTSNPRGQFHLHVTDPARETIYRFGTGTADFHICTECGIIPIVTSVLDGARYAVFNVNTFDDVARSEIAEVPTDFAAEAPGDRLARRKRTWTPQAPAAY